MEIKITKNPNPKAKPADESKLGFGKVFTDHMFLMDWDIDKGWHDARIVPYGPLSLSPACTALHYALEVFEGLKAYRTADGKIQMFRPYENANRLNRSAERIIIPVRMARPFRCSFFQRNRHTVARCSLIILFEPGFCTAARKTEKYRQDKNRR